MFLPAASFAIRRLVRISTHANHRARAPPFGVAMRSKSLIASVQSFTTGIRTELMKDFSNASFPPEIIGTVKEAMDAAVASLPDPISSAYVQSIAEATSHGQGWGERSRDLATHGAIGTADHAARLTECKLFTKALNALKTTFPKWPETNPC
jgi:hypothetical protein